MTYTPEQVHKQENEGQVDHGPQPEGSSFDHHLNYTPGAGALQDPSGHVSEGHHPE